MQSARPDPQIYELALPNMGIFKLLYKHLRISDHMFVGYMFFFLHFCAIFILGWFTLILGPSYYVDVSLLKKAAVQSEATS